MEFKIGDEVIVHLDLEDSKNEYIGQVGKVVSTDEHRKLNPIYPYPYKVQFNSNKFNNNTRVYNEKEISLNIEKDIERFWLMRFKDA